MLYNVKIEWICIILRKEEKLMGGSVVAWIPESSMLASLLHFNFC